MHDCANDIIAHHNEKVTLPQPYRNTMRAHRDANRVRMNNGLIKNGNPAPIECKSQGSYAMKTMVQHPENDYDIDDGIYFEKTSLIGDRGAEMTALQARKMVRDAVDDGRFNTAPEIIKNCVRIYYAAGYHVDMPVYRRVTMKDIFDNETHHYELASSEWKKSDARDVTDWFEAQNKKQSSDITNGRQLRRVIRHIKKFSRSRTSWSGQTLSGFGITKLAVEVFCAGINREDQALYDTMNAIRKRLAGSLIIKHPVTPNETITNGSDDAKARFLCNKLTDAIDQLAPTLESDCTREKALKCWDKVFNTNFFSERGNASADSEQKSAIASPAVLTAGLISSAAAPAKSAVRKEGGGRYA